MVNLNQIFTFQVFLFHRFYVILLYTLHFFRLMIHERRDDAMNTESIEPEAVLTEEVLTEESAQENTSCKPVRQEQTIMFYMPLMEAFEPNGEIEVPIKEYPANDTGNARRFLDLFRNGLRYCAAEKEWYCFHKTCWVKDTACIVPQLAKLGPPAGQGRPSRRASHSVP